MALLGASLAGCAREAPPTVAPGASVPAPAPTPPAPSSSIAARAPEPASPVAPPSADAGSSTADPARCEGELPPADLLRDNIASTAMTGLAEIVAATKTSLDGTSPAPSSGYVTFRYDVRVLRWLSGAGPDRLVLRQGAEAPGTPQRPGRLLFFSACASADGSAYEPDVGYFFPVDAACRADAEALGEAAAKRARAGKHKPRACERPRG